ncbi:hypothetical protein NIES4074_41160 [Cylindrospermum sp. NIES-4074]|nr:hypothetical protein NIES4074_41160 [Cylindrospermum sp. NIES-4074]
MLIYFSLTSLIALTQLYMLTVNLSEMCHEHKSLPRCTRLNVCLSETCFTDHNLPVAMVRMLSIAKLSSTLGRAFGTVQPCF